jgi:death on curing protein
VAEPTWIDLSVVLAVHDEQLAEHGGATGLRDLRLLESALARPRNVYAYESAARAALAASYAFGIANNHPFLDGNKRTSFVVAELFLAVNGMDLAVDDDDVVMTWLKLASGQISESELASWITASCQTR